MPPCAKFAFAPCSLIQATWSFGLAPGNRLAADQQHRRVVDEADRLEGGLRVVAQVVEQARRRQQRDMIHEHGRAVGRRARDAIVGDRAPAADLVLDHDRAAERARHVLADEPRHGVGTAARRVRNDDRHGLSGRLRRRLRCEGSEQKANACQRVSAIDHDILPVLVAREAMPPQAGGQRSTSAMPVGRIVPRSGLCN